LKSQSAIFTFSKGALITAVTVESDSVRFSDMVSPWRPLVRGNFCDTEASESKEPEASRLVIEIRGNPGMI
jgi:hypothetical protein